jgi:hypothetical protein
MPRFFFDIRCADGTVIRDEAGGDFKNLDAARSDAQRGLADIIAEEIIEREPLNVVAIDIRDEDDRVVSSIVSNVAEGPVGG